MLEKRPIGQSDRAEVRVQEDAIIVVASGDAPTTFALLVAAHHLAEEVDLPVQSLIIDREGGAPRQWVDDLPDPLVRELSFLWPRDLAAWRLDRLRSRSWFVEEG